MGSPKASFLDDIEQLKSVIQAFTESVENNFVYKNEKETKRAKNEVKVFLVRSMGIISRLSVRGKEAMAEGDELRDFVNAYQTQNKCLNKEIIKLNEEIGEMEKKKQDLQLKCCEWEAKCCQVHSKLLSLLKELKQTIEMSETSETSQDILISSNKSVKDLVSRLFEEGSLDIPLSWRPGNRKRNELPNSSGDQEYDELGFLIKQPDFESELNENLAQIKPETRLRKSFSNDPETARQHLEWKMRWETFIANLKSYDLQRNLELKCLLRTGIPQEYRCKIWRMLINLRVKSVKDKFGIDYYQKLCTRSSETKVNPAVKQIELDLLRTLPNNKHFHSIKSPGIMRLRKVLTAYSLHNPNVGYCQGMNRLAAVALLFMPEEDAFWCLVTIVENIMPANYFVSNLLGAHVDQYVLRDLLAEKMPQLHSHFEKYGLELSLFSWFLTCFVDNLPSDIYLRIWDVFLYEGNKVLFRFALAFLKYHSQTLLSLEDSLGINQYLRILGYRTTDVSHLFHIAFYVLNPFRMSKVKAKRQHYSHWVMNELNKLDQTPQSLSLQENNDNSDSE